MKKNKLFDSKFLVLFLGLSIFGLTPTFALEDDEADYGPSASGTGDLTAQVMALNGEIKALVVEEKKFLVSGVVDSSCLDNLTILHNQFGDILVHYKPFEVKWATYNPIKNFKVAPGNADELSALLVAMQDTYNQLEVVFVQMQNLTDCSVPIVYDTTTYVYPEYPVYYYSYPDYSSYYYPLLFGIGAWGLWNGWGWNNWHNWHDGHRRDGHRRDGHRRDVHRQTGTNRTGTRTNRTGTHVNRTSGTHVNRTSGTRVNRTSGTHVNRSSGTHVNRSSGHSGGRMGGGGGGGGGRGHGGGGGHHR